MHNPHTPAQQISLWISEVEKKARRISEETGVPGGAGMSFGSPAGDVRVSLRLKQSRTKTSASPWYSKNFALGGKVISRRDLETALSTSMEG